MYSVVICYQELCYVAVFRCCYQCCCYMLPRVIITCYQGLLCAVLLLHELLYVDVIKSFCRLSNVVACNLLHAVQCCYMLPRGITCCSLLTC